MEQSEYKYTTGELGAPPGPTRFRFSSNTRNQLSGAVSHSEVNLEYCTLISQKQKLLTHGSIRVQQLAVVHVF